METIELSNTTEYKWKAPQGYFCEYIVGTAKAMYRAFEQDAIKVGDTIWMRNKYSEDEWVEIVVDSSETDSN